MMPAEFTPSRTDLRAERLDALAEVLFRSYPLPAWIYERRSLRIVAANDAAESCFQFSGEEFRTMTMPEILPAAAAEWLVCAPDDVAGSDGDAAAGLVLSPSFERDGIVVRSAFLTAVSSHRAEIDRLERLAYADRPTGLPNRAALERRLAQTEAHSITAVALLRLEWIGLGLASSTIASIDRLRAAAGDRVCDHAIDGLEIYAYDDRTFAFVFDAPQSARAARTFLRVLVREFDQPLDAGDARLSARPTASLADTFANAQTALETALERNETLLEFTPEVRTIAERHTAIDRGLRAAIAGHELSVVYQPAIAFATGTIVAIEALVRWDSAEFGRVPTAELIANAEASGFIERIGEWVLDRAFSDFSILPLADTDRPRLCINISARELRRRELYGAVDHAAAKYGLRWDDLEVEVSEKTLMDEVRTSGSQLLRAMRDRGARISLDDFGTGYSSLKNISALPLDSVKIDPTFVRSLPGDPIKRLIVGSLIDLSKRRGIRTVAEGAETSEEIAAVRELGCDAVQGYALSRPMDVTELVRFLRSYDIQRRAVSG
jgi:EAL domain-containing protein (putative c-di-GMP-specific phosphodiesterase class I)